jgi:putative sterol carrier protein
MQAFKRTINESAEYRMRSNNWELPVVLVRRADPKTGEPRSCVYLDLWHGTCREARIGTTLDIERAPIVISSDRGTWLDLLSGKVELLTAVMLRKISIDRGSTSQLLGSVPAVRALVKCAAAASKGFD